MTLLAAYRSFCLSRILLITSGPVFCLGRAMCPQSSAVSLQSCLLPQSFLVDVVYLSLMCNISREREFYKEKSPTHTAGPCQVCSQGAVLHNSNLRLLWWIQILHRWKDEQKGSSPLLLSMDLFGMWDFRHLSMFTVDLNFEQVNLC